jgi:hypothetical protein
MGDFEDAFGAGADAVDIIDGICRAEARYEREEILSQEIIEHRIWFADYASAERWEREHHGTPFKRRKSQGGYEVTVVDHRGAAGDLRNKELSSGIIRTDETREVLFAEGLSGQAISYGSYCVRLAERTTPLLVAFQAHLRRKVPLGRAALSPIILSLKELRSAFKGATEYLSHEFEMGLGIVAIFTPDHRFLVGRRSGQDVQLWPWELELTCGNGNTSKAGSCECFLCGHYDACDLYGEFAGNGELWEPENPDHKHYIPKERYESKNRPRDLARCMTDWLEILSPFDARLGDRFQAPSSVMLQHRDKKKHKAQMDGWCAVLARMIAVQEEGDVYVTVSFGLTHDPDTLPQTGPDEMMFIAHKSRPSADDLSIFEMFRETTTSSDVDFMAPIPNWSEVVGFSIAGADSLLRSSWSKKTLSEAAFSTLGLSAHEKMEAVQDSKEFLGNEIPVSIRKFLETAYDQKPSDDLW